MFIRSFYIVAYLYLSENCIYYSVICKDSSGYNWQNVLYTIKSDLSDNYIWFSSSLCLLCEVTFI